MNKTFFRNNLSLKELESFRKILKSLLFESYVASVLYLPGNFTRMKLNE